MRFQEEATELPKPLLVETLPWTALLSAQTSNISVYLLKNSGASSKTASAAHHLAVLLFDEALGILDVFVELLDVTRLSLELRELLLH